MQDDREPGLALVGRRQRERRAGRSDRRLRPADPLGHRRLGHEPRLRDLGGCEATDRPQRQRELRRGRERRMAAEEEQGQRVVLLRHEVVGPGRVEGVGREQRGRSRLAPLTGEVRAELIGHASGRHGDEPASRVVRDALVGPLGRAGEEGFLDRVLGPVELAVPADDGAEDLRGKLPQQVLDADVGRHPLTSPSPASSMTGRISTQPYSDSGPATSIARSRLSTSTWKRPASSSLTSLYGPVRHGRHAVDELDVGLVPAETLDANQLPGLLHLFDDLVVVAEDPVGLLLGQRLPELRVRVDEDHVLHGGLLSWRPAGAFEPLSELRRWASTLSGHDDPCVRCREPGNRLRPTDEPGRRRRSNQQ